MSTLLEQASLVLIPSGYKEDIVYSVIPNDATGDLSFTRASNGTRINFDGLVEVCPWNLLQQSETFNTTWSASNTVVTANQTTAPNDTLTADLIVDNASNTSHSLTQSVTNLSVGLDYYYSIYVKNNNHTWVLLRHDNGGTFNYFNIATGVKGTNTQANSTIENVGNGWYKLTVPFNVASSSSGPEFYLASADGTYIYAGTGTGVYIWGASYTLSAKPYFPTTDRLNVPRLTYQNGGGGCPSLLLEPQRTNVLTYSEDFSNGAWTKEQVSVTANTTTSPNGTQNADSIIENTANADHLIYQGIAVSAATYTQSVFMKKNTRQYAFLQIATDNAVNRYTIVVDLDNGSVTATSTAGSPTGTSYKIDSMGNGWYRLTVTATHTVGTVYTIFGLSNSANPTFSIVATPTYTGNGTGSIYVWGAQLEAGAYQSSYIPTVASSATRIVDACSKTGISSLIGQTEGVMFIDYNYDAKPDTNGNIPMVIYDGSNEAYIFITSGGSVRLELYDAGVLQCLLTTSIGAVGRKKIAFGYKQNDFVGYMNGVQIATDTSGTVGAMSNLYVGSYYTATYNANGGINQAILFPTRLTNSELALITSL